MILLHMLGYAWEVSRGFQGACLILGDPPGDRPAGSMDHLAAPTRPTRLVSGVSFSELVVIT